MRPFTIDVDARDRWLAAMTSALDAAELDPDVRQAFDEYFAMAAESMRNQFPT